MVKYILVILLIAFELQLGISKELPAFFKTCKRNEDMDPCIKSAIQDALPKLRKDIPDFGLKSIDPLAIDDIFIAAGTKTVRLNQRYGNVKACGFSDSKITGVKAILEENNMKLYLNFTSPKLEFTGTYEFDGNLMALPLNGKGKYTWDLENIAFITVLIGETKTQKGKIYMIIKHVDIKFTPSKMIIHLDNLFNGNQALSSEFNNLINKNWRDVDRELQPGYGPIVETYQKKGIFTNSGSKLDVMKYEGFGLINISHFASYDISCTGDSTRVASLELVRIQ